MTSVDELQLAWSQLKPYYEIASNADKLPRKPIYGFLRLTLSPFLRTGLRLKYRGLEHIPRKGPTILAANHLSHVDPIIVISAARRTTHYLAKDGHFSNPFTRIVMTSTGQIETKRESGGADALSSAATVLSSQRALGIFPEGTRSRKTEPPYLLEGKTGIARLSASYPDTRVVPIALMGTRDVMAPATHKIPRFWKRIEVHAGQSISWYEWLTDLNGGNYSLTSLQELSMKQPEEIKAELSRLYRLFTNQLMETLRHLGAP
ncbi:MAG: lysophospholipid acyltransferase family protein [Candidatus Poseidoniales archaeon]|jgi:1-acyl-sn-glycerol-3-phosphate acyltransferase